MIEKEELFHLLSLHARDAFLFTCISDHKRYKITKINSFYVLLELRKLLGHLAVFGSSFLLEGFFL